MRAPVSQFGNDGGVDIHANGFYGGRKHVPDPDSVEHGRKNEHDGTITQKVAGYAENENESLLRLGTVFPLPLKTVKTFVASLDSFSIAEGSYPVIEMQIGDRSKLKGTSLSAPPPPFKGNRKGSKNGLHPYLTVLMRIRR